MKDTARKSGGSMGKVLSDLARETLSRHASADTRNGVPLLPIRPGSAVVALEPVISRLAVTRRTATNELTK